MRPTRARLARSPGLVSLRRRPPALLQGVCACACAPVFGGERSRARTGVSHAARASAAWGLMSTSDRYPGTVCTACLCFMVYLLSGHRYAGRDVAIPDPAAYLHTLQQTTTVSRQIQSHKQSAPAYAFGLSGGVEKHIGRKVRMEVAF